MAQVKRLVKPRLSPSRILREGDQIENERFVTTLDADTTLDAEDVVLADGSSNTVTLTLPAPTYEGQTYTIKAIDITSAVDVDTAGSETIDGASSYTFTTQYDSITVVADAKDGDYHIVAEMLNA